ncbi:TonB-dependent receptor [Polymorphobacter sp. PAMC 29334]|uniref:TonB-dependent receptor n=1 Tax=Polymorphobacter sp. PAMC 29334 TaxID=2862331 RepID=UPI001C66D3D7|nr:TonB-dependent receptor [Polymorphobacter sp. PAMC 29334]QYE34571.1 TonB-dependent receptor [Polymorphobacter sp. PAMC 29334]
MTMKSTVLQTAALSFFALTVPQGASAQDVAAAQAEAGGDGEIVVTAQRRSELINNVPLAITALSGSDLKTRQVSDGSDLERAVPNMSFTRAAFGSTNYSIRGVGYQVVSTTADTGVGVDENNAPLAVNRLADAEFFDVQRIEVLRGPQGTLYGRNATGGVIDVITNKPVDKFEASLSGGYGNYDSRKLQGMINVPLGPVFSLRVAGSALKRDGFQQNSVTGNDIDARNLYSTRATLAFTPSSNFHAFAMWEHFNEDDSRFGGQKFLCSKDVGPSSVGGVTVNTLAARNFLSRGCLKDSIHSQSSQTGNVNSVATLGGSLSYLYGLVSGDVNGGSQSGDQRTLSQNIDPTYKARNDLFQLNLQWDVTPNLQLTSLTAYSNDRLDTRAEFQSATIPFNNTVVTPGGVFTDPQTGTSRFLNLDTDYDVYRTKQWSQEIRLQSSFSGPVNFNLGAFYMHLNRFNNIFILSNGETAVTAIRNLLGGNSYIDPNANPNSQGHNYFDAYNPYTLNSRAAFGEIYWQASDTVRVTAGLRYTSDHKDYTNYPITILTDGKGFPDTLVEQRANFGELTGRANVDWRPMLSFTDKTLVYASFSRGYKAGGFNPPNVVEVPPIYAPEFVNSFEIGTKNTLFDDHATLNLTAFHYDYKGYQISQGQGLNEATANVDAKIYGVEVETTWSPTDRLRFNAQAGYLHSSIGAGSSVDTYDRLQGDPSLIYLKSLTSGCVAAVADVAKLITLINAGKVAANVLTGACPTEAAPNGAYASRDPSKNSLAALGIVLPTSTGDPVNLKGKRLPNAPSFTATLGAQYALDLGHDWQAVARGDVYHQSSFYTDIYNNEDNRLNGWNTVNLSV